MAQQLQVYKAKALVGVFSDYAVDEAREKFWKSIESGQSFGKRMTFWDAIFSIGSSRRATITSLIKTNSPCFAIPSLFVIHIIHRFKACDITACFY